MSRTRIAAALALALAIAPAAPPVHAAPPTRPVSPARVAGWDANRWMDVNQLGMTLTNLGSWAYDLNTGSAGLCFPRGTNQGVIFASGLWFGAQVSGQTRAVVGEYSQEYGPGRILPGGAPDAASSPQYVVYKVAAADTSHLAQAVPPGTRGDVLAHHSWSEYMAGAAPYGAPWTLHRLPTPGVPGDSVDVPGPPRYGDRMAWSVYNDADPALHTNNAGNSPPLGLEIRQTTFAYDAPGASGHTIFLVFDVIHPAVYGTWLNNAYVGLWMDPDVGGPADDLAGCDTTLSLGYAYNGTNSDFVYGVTPPAVGCVLIQGPKVGATRLGMTAFDRFVNGTDPLSRDMTYAYLRGLDGGGSPIVDPISGLTTRFMCPGDPLTGGGWMDATPADKRILLSAGPFTMAPGDTQRIVAAIVVAQGSDRIASVAGLRFYAQQAISAWQSGLPVDEEPPAYAVACPRPASFWADQCPAGSGNALSAAQVDSIASKVDAISRFFSWSNPKSGPFCGAVDPAVQDARTAARSEFAALLANRAAGMLGMHESNGWPIFVNSSVELSCPGVPARTVADLLAVPDTGGPRLMGADYLDLVATNPTALAGVPIGLSEFFNGGAGPASMFFASDLDPAAQPDSFCTVELRFSHTATQKAYRYLRLEQWDGTPPTVGRTYRYAGFRDVPFTAWDVDHDVQLDVAFVERAITDASGALLPPIQQIATFDSTWTPDASELGGREYLFVLRRPYQGTPRAEFAVDGYVASGTGPWLYAIWSKLVTETSVIDDGDAFRFTWGAPPDTTFESLMVALEGQSLLDPAVAARYAQIASCLHAVNAGDGYGPICQAPTPVQVSLAGADAAPDRVTLSWYATSSAFAATLERREGSAAWQPLALVGPDGSGTITYVDRAVEPGHRYGYRLDPGAGEPPLGEAWVDVPTGLELALAGLRPNPATHGATVRFTLPSRGAGRLELFDVAGRRAFVRDLGDLAPGPHAIRVDESRALAPGLYLVRLTHGGRSLTARGVVVR